VSSVDALFIFFNGRPPPPLHLQSMVGRNGLFSGYKSQRTKGHKGMGKDKKKPRTVRIKRQTRKKLGDRRREKIERNENQKHKEITEKKKHRGKNTGNKEQHREENQPHIYLHSFISKPKVTERKQERVW